MKREPVRAYINRWGEYEPDATCSVIEDTRSARVTYRNEAGKAFRVNVFQKPNPIGFTSKLPGDSKGRR